MTGDERVALSRVMAEVLVELSGELELLGASLCSDATLVRDHIGHLQKIDLIAQTQRSLASVLEAEHLARAVEGLNLDSLRDRLKLI